MNREILIWLGLFAGLTVLAFKRPAWGVALYMLTTFVCPPFWKWGRPIAEPRWVLYAGIILLVAVLLSRATGDPRRNRAERPETRRLCWIAIAMLVNATFVHLALADRWSLSSERYDLLAKFVLLFFLIAASIQTPRDFRTVLWSIVLGAAYIGYEVTINDRGRIRGNRLEDVGMPAASTANGLACLMVTTLPIAGGLFLTGGRWQRLAMLPVAPMILNVVLKCNSRGAFLGLIGMVLIFLMMAPKKVRRQILKLATLGLIALWFLMGDPRIVDRFLTTFVGSEERDHSAASRMDFWAAGLRMVSDHPLGAGGHGFKRAHGAAYITEETGRDSDGRSVHNGFINEACEWGIQGLVLRLLFYGGAILLLVRSARTAVARGDKAVAILATAMLAGTSGVMIQSMFGNYLDAEWSYWMIALSVGQARLVYATRPAAQVAAYRSACGPGLLLGPSPRMLRGGL